MAINELDTVTMMGGYRTFQLQIACQIHYEEKEERH